MEGFVSNLMVCNLAYSGKLEELKEEILSDKSLATRTDQVKRRWDHFAGAGGDVGQRGCLARPKRRQVPRGPDSRPCRPILTPGHLRTQS